MRAIVVVMQRPRAEYGQERCILMQVAISYRSYALNKQLLILGTNNNSNAEAEDLDKGPVSNHTLLQCQMSNHKVANCKHNMQKPVVHKHTRYAVTLFIAVEMVVSYRIWTRWSMR